VNELEEQKVSCYQNKKGMVIVNAKLSQEEGVLFMKAMKEMMRQLETEETNTVELTNVSAESPLVKEQTHHQKQAKR
jgi:hypothetical protein